MFVCGITEDDPQIFDEETALDRAKKTIGIPDLDIELISLTHWTVNAVYASEWRTGRCFLVGDSAHRIPPWGGKTRMRPRHHHRLLTLYSARYEHWNPRCAKSYMEIVPRTER